ncbi:peptidoglycan DD-metalloendopeptidase family protein [Paenibacillus algorifonticola]|uniref:M23 family metallopeptidase n=1 Tax=Paenibacillus algorifonticola TaxID=684063 RepID=UPI003D2B4240
MQDKVLKTVKTVQQARKVYQIIAALGSSSVLAIIAIILALLFVLLIIGLTFLPFLLFAQEGSLSNQTGMEAGWAPVRLEEDGSEYMWPVPTITRISSYFGIRNIGAGAEAHGGIDIADGAPKTELQPIYAMAAGVVTVAGNVSGYGRAIYIDHGSGLVSIYGHLDARMDVKPGDQVGKGQRIGLIGAGKVGRSTGPHLHFEIKLNGKRVNPLDYVQPSSQLPGDLSYRSLKIAEVKAYLEGKKSALADVAILQAIDAAGRQQNVDPHLLIAITGQEQSFVPANRKNAALIVKNPWNVFGCWCSGRGATLTTERSALIAAKTIVKLSEDRPAGRNAIEWLSAKDNPRGYYAEHAGWWIGVSKFYKTISKL